MRKGILVGQLEVKRTGIQERGLHEFRELDGRAARMFASLAAMYRRLKKAPRITFICKSGESHDATPSVPRSFKSGKTPPSRQIFGKQSSGWRLSLEDTAVIQPSPASCDVYRRASSGMREGLSLL